MNLIYETSIAIVFGFGFFGTFWRLQKLVFDEKCFKIYLFSFNP